VPARLRSRAVGAVAAALAAIGAAPAAAQEECVREADPSRWQDAGTPDVGRRPPTIAAHRGAAELAPEDTMWAFRYAIAYGVEMIEVDVQQLRDGRFVVFHDPRVEDKTDGGGRIADMDYEEVRRLNAADNEKWKGSRYDPSRIPPLEQVLELARRTNTGIYFDIPESVTDLTGLAQMAAKYGVVERSSFLTYDPGRGEVIKAAEPRAQLMLSKPEELTQPEALYGFTERYRWFGSGLPGYTPEQIAAIHDGCGLVIPNVYQGFVTKTEAGDLRHALSIGADGAQVNNPDVAAEVLAEPVRTRVTARRVGRRGLVTCLRNPDKRQGLPEKPLRVGRSTVATAKRGCVWVPGGWGRRVAFAGDGSALPSRLSHSR
jgi:Glycerophosphoryl diester phosphodiesterase family